MDSRLDPDGKIPLIPNSFSSLKSTCGIIPPTNRRIFSDLTAFNSDTSADK
jgi:hypothetical protein